MGIVIKKIKLWRRDLQNRPGALADSLEPFADSRVDLQLIMGYVHEGNPRKAGLEVYSPAGKTFDNAARKAKFSPARHIYCVMVEGDNRPGLACNISQALGSAGINMRFAIMQKAGRRYSATFGFESDAVATRAIAVIRSASSASTGHRKSSSRRRAGHRVVGTRKLAMAPKPAGRSRGRSAARAATSRKSGRRKR